MARAASSLRRFSRRTAAVLLVLVQVGARDGGDSGADHAADDGGDLKLHVHPGPRGHNLHLVDVPLVVCPGGPGKVRINISLTDVPEKDRKIPHVLTFYRVSSKPVTIRYDAIDAINLVITEKMQVELPDVTEKNGTESNHSERRLLDDAGHVNASDGEASARKLAFGRPMKTQKVIVRGRIKKVGRRHRGSYRGGSVGGGFAGRGNIGTGGGWVNPNNPSARVYGYSSGVDQLARSFPNGYVRTNNGYSGYSAVRNGMVQHSERREKVRLDVPSHVYSARHVSAAAVAGGMLAMSRWNTLTSGGAFGEQCTWGMQWYGSCMECYHHHPIGCSVAWTPHRVLARDNLMDTGFTPFDISTPFVVTVYEVEGPDFKPELVCSSMSTDANFKPPETADLFVSITKVERFEDEEWVLPDEDANHVIDLGDPRERRIFCVLLGFVICSCLCFTVVLCRVLQPAFHTDHSAPTTPTHDYSPMTPASGRSS